MSDLFSGSLREYTLPLPQDELRLLTALPEYGDEQCVQGVSQADEAPCRRLERRGLVKVHRWKDDPLSIRPTLYAGRLAPTPPAASGGG